MVGGCNSCIGRSGTRSCRSCPVAASQAPSSIILGRDSGLEYEQVRICSAGSAIIHTLRMWHVLARCCQFVAGPIGPIAPGIARSETPYFPSHVDDASAPVASGLREMPPVTSTVGQNAEALEKPQVETFPSHRWEYYSFLTVIVDDDHQRMIIIRQFWGCFHPSRNRRHASHSAVELGKPPAAVTRFNPLAWP